MCGASGPESSVGRYVTPPTAGVQSGGEGELSNSTSSPAAHSPANTRVYCCAAKSPDEPYTRFRPGLRAAANLVSRCNCICASARNPRCASAPRGRIPDGHRPVSGSRREREKKVFLCFGASAVRVQDDAMRCDARPDDALIPSGRR